MSKTYRPWDPDQQWIFPPSPRDWLPQHDLVYFLMDVVAGLDISAITDKYEKEQRGQPPYHPRMMVAVLLHGYCMGIYSSRRIQRACERDAAFRVIVGDDVPNFRTISDFRKLHLDELQGLLVQVLRLCAEAGLVKVGHISLDGTKVKANASRHKAMSYERMERELERLRQEVRDMLSRAEAADESEDTVHGRARRGDELPEELGRRQSRIEKIEQAKAALEEEARVVAEIEEERRRQEDEQRRQDGQRPLERKPLDGKPRPKDQYNFTDPESRIMKTPQGFDQCGNAQIVANEQQIVISADVTREANDKREVDPMIAQAQRNLEDAGVADRPAVLTADSGYYSEQNVRALEDEGIDPYIAVERLKHRERIPASPRGRIPGGQTTKQRMVRKLRTKKGRAIYAKRKSILEPIFGQIKQARGFRQFLLRGLDKMRGEWSLICTVHNLLKLYASGRMVAG